MSDYDYGPLRTYELTWRTGHIERLQGHQVMFESDRNNITSLMGGAFGDLATVADTLPPRFKIHGQIDGHWRLLIAAPESDLASIRDVTADETMPESEATA